MHKLEGRRDPGEKGGGRDGEGEGERWIGWDERGWKEGRDGDMEGRRTDSERKKRIKDPTRKRGR